MLSKIRSTIFVFLADHRKSSCNEDDDHDDSCDEQRNLNSMTNNHGLVPAFMRKNTTEAKETNRTNNF